MVVVTHTHAWDKTAQNSTNTHVSEGMRKMVRPD